MCRGRSAFFHRAVPDRWEDDLSERNRGSNDPDLIDLRKNQYAFKSVIERNFKDLDIKADEVLRWRPFHGKGSIVIDPERSFRQLVAAASGVPTEVQGFVARVAALYEVDRSVVTDAVRFHEELAAA